MNVEICCPTNMPSLVGDPYLMFLPDEFSSICGLFFKEKLDALRILKKRKEMVVNDFGRRIKVLRSSNMKEFVVIFDFCKKE